MSIFISRKEGKAQREKPLRLGVFARLLPFILEETWYLSINLPSPREQEGWQWVWSGQTLPKIALQLQAFSGCR